MGLDISLVKVEYLLDMNITHNLVPMWKEAGIYAALYNSDGLDARDVFPELVDGLTDMILYPDKYKALNSPNGWGTYENAVRWLAELVKGFEEHSSSRIMISK